MPQASTLKPAETHSLAAASAYSPDSSQPLSFAMLSDPGRVRRTNEDACAAHPDRAAFVLCDGMGGAAAGEVASRLAAETFLSSLTQPRRIPPRAAQRLHAAPPSPRARLEDAIRAANHAVYKHSQKSRTLRGMGTTLVALLADDTTLFLAHVGDSRCYRLRHGALDLLTQDHSLVEEQIQAGLISRLDAESSPIRNIITRAIGSQPTVDPEIATLSTQPGDLYLLASDGLTRELSDPEIAHILTHSSTLDTAAHALIDRANAHGGHDNITVLLVAIP